MLSLDEDRVCVQVKSGDGAANHDVVLRLIGSVSNTRARTGLLVSNGGVNAVAQKELDKNFFKLRLWQIPDLLKALFRTYGDLSDETRAKLPLKIDRGADISLTFEPSHFHSRWAGAGKF
jgi:restriction system protein